MTTATTTAEEQVAELQRRLDETYAKHAAACAITDECRRARSELAAVDRRALAKTGDENAGEVVKARAAIADNERRFVEADATRKATDVAMRDMERQIGEVYREHFDELVEVAERATKAAVPAIEQAIDEGFAKARAAWGEAAALWAPLSRVDSGIGSVQPPDFLTKSAWYAKDNIRAPRPDGLGVDGVGNVRRRQG